MIDENYELMLKVYERTKHALEVVPLDVDELEVYSSLAGYYIFPNNTEKITFNTASEVIDAKKKTIKTTLLAVVISEIYYRVDDVDFLNRASYKMIDALVLMEQLVNELDLSVKETDVNIDDMVDKIFEMLKESDV
jgi:hypothetical protein